ncbi:MAG: hypothetical protein LBT59_11640 [Clostridiales bacterium]|nr:hypothetical protein [Clostridiales bacterium]
MLFPEWMNADQRATAMSRHIAELNYNDDLVASFEIGLKKGYEQALRAEVKKVAINMIYRGTDDAHITEWTNYSKEDIAPLRVEAEAKKLLAINMITLGFDDEAIMERTQYFKDNLVALRIEVEAEKPLAIRMINLGADDEAILKCTHYFKRDIAALRAEAAEAKADIPEES